MNEVAFDPKKFYLSMEGRVGRSDFWLKLMLPVIVGAIVIGVVAGSNNLVSIIFNLAILWPSIAVTGKRWHDRDKSAWWMLISVIPVIGWIWAFVENGCLKGTEGDNRFGPAPV